MLQGQERLGTVTNDSGNTFNLSIEQGERHHAKSGAQPESRRIVREYFCLAQSREMTITRFLSRRLVLDNIGAVSNA